MFILMHTWMNGKNFMKQNYLKKKIYSNVNMEDITDVDYIQKEFVEILKWKKLGRYHDFLS